MHRSDQDLQAAVSDELLYTPSIDTNLSVSVIDGTVTLSGDVGSVPERLAAARVTEHVWGVKTVVDKMVVRCAASGTADAELEEMASKALEWTVDVPVDAVTVEVRDGVITLSGAVTWDFQRTAAARTVSYIRGIAGVTNNISLRQGSSVVVVKDNVETAIARNAPLDAAAITIDVAGHELTLDGSVRSFGERRQAEDAAWAAAGVTTVNNHLFITS